MPFDSNASANKDNADVFDRVIGEQALEIVLHQGIQHSERRGCTAEQQHHHALPPCRVA
jgi:hypothetical protein